eukprot:SAG31_NODE_211_length_20274_cov_40.333482_23_plen_785_part_00
MRMMDGIEEEEQTEVYTAAIAAVFSAWQLIVWENSATRHLDAVLQMPGRGRHLAMKQHAQSGAQRVLALLAQLDRQQMTLNGSRAALIVHSRWYRTLLDGALCLLHSRAARSTVKHLLQHWAVRVSSVSRARLQANHMAVSKMRGAQRMAFHGWQNIVSNSRCNQAVVAVILTRPAFRHRKVTLRVAFTAWVGMAVWHSGTFIKDGGSLKQICEIRTSMAQSDLQVQRKRTLYEAIHTPSSSSPSPDSKETRWSGGIASRQRLVPMLSDPSEPLIASALSGQHYRSARLSSTPSSMQSCVSSTSENRSPWLRNPDAMTLSTTTVLAEVPSCTPVVTLAQPGEQASKVGKLMVEVRSPAGVLTRSQSQSIDINMDLEQEMNVEMPQSLECLNSDDLGGDRLATAEGKSGHMDETTQVRDLESKLVPKYDESWVKCVPEPTRTIDCIPTESGIDSTPGLKSSASLSMSLHEDEPLVKRTHLNLQSGVNRHCEQAVVKPCNEEPVAMDKDECTQQMQTPSFEVIFEAVPTYPAKEHCAPDSKPEPQRRRTSFEVARKGSLAQPLDVQRQVLKLPAENGHWAVGPPQIIKNRGASLPAQQYDHTCEGNLLSAATASEALAAAEELAEAATAAHQAISQRMAAFRKQQICLSQIGHVSALDTDPCGCLSGTKVGMCSPQQYCLTRGQLLHYEIWKEAHPAMPSMQLFSGRDVLHCGMWNFLYQNRRGFGPAATSANGLLPCGYGGEPTSRPCPPRERLCKSLRAKALVWLCQHSSELSHGNATVNHKNR